MKKMVKTLLCLMMALAMSLSLAVPAFAASTVSKETCSHNTGGSYVGQVRTAEPHGDPTTYHRVYTSNRFYCSTCKKYYTVHASESYTLEKHKDRGETENVVSSSNHTLANPAKHTYTRAVYYSVCGQLKSRDTVFAGCTAAGCRLTQRVDPVPVAA
ncbi:unknown [Oscillibacter sp. CAG:241]|jgi:hypothetical protein|nr:unknown [Oscillibacter sp. CAG:241]